MGRLWVGAGADLGGEVAGDEGDDGVEGWFVGEDDV